MCVLIFRNSQPQFALHYLKSQVLRLTGSYPHFGQRGAQEQQSTRTLNEFRPVRASRFRARSGGKNARKVRTAPRCAKRRQRIGISSAGRSKKPMFMSHIVLVINKGKWYILRRDSYYEDAGIQPESRGSIQ